MIAMDEYGMVALIEGDLHDSLHHCIWDLDFLCAVHLEDLMADAVRLHEAGEVIIEGLLPEGAVTMVSLIVSILPQTLTAYMIVFRPRVPRY